MTDDTMNQSMSSEAEANAAAGARTTDAGDGAEGSVAEELRTLGQRLAAALKAAATTEEAESLKADVSEGIHQLRQQLDQTLESTKTTTQKATAESSDLLNQLRSELASALRLVNRALDKVAATIEPMLDGDSAAAKDGSDGSGESHSAE